MNVSASQTLVTILDCSHLNGCVEGSYGFPGGLPVILSKVPSYFIGEEIELQGPRLPKMLSVALADERIQTR